MNLHGYKLKAKAIARAIREEDNKPSNKQSSGKLKRLLKARNRISRTIGELKKAKLSKRK